MEHQHQVDMVDDPAHPLLATDQEELAVVAEEAAGEAAVVAAAPILLPINPVFLVEVAAPEIELHLTVAAYSTVVDNRLCVMKKKNDFGK
jgi:hypothetical protein